MRELLRRVRRGPDRVRDALHDMTRDVRSVIITLGLVIVVMGLAFAGSWLSDRAAGGPAAREAASQSLQNGKNLCEFNRAVADAFATFLEAAPRTTPEGQHAIDRMVQVAAECEPEAPEDALTYNPPEEP